MMPGIPRLACVVTLAVAVLAVGAAPAVGGDWPQWRGDAARSAVGSELLPDELRLSWSVSFGRRQGVWKEVQSVDRIRYDTVLEPVVAGGRMFVGFNDTDKVVAMDVATGKELWRFYTGGPVRLPVAAWNPSTRSTGSLRLRSGSRTRQAGSGQANVYAVSDDGYLYCLDAASGALKWKHRGGPAAHKCLGNERLVSMWPARGGPVVRDGVVYFAASIWPFLGTFIWALDAETGGVRWVNDRSSGLYNMQAHAAMAFASVAPQGPLVATEKMLLVPGGRTLPAGLDRATGQLLYYDGSGVSGGGGSLVVANETHFFTYSSQRATRAVLLATGVNASWSFYSEPVLDGETLYVYGGSSAKAKGAKAAPAKRNAVVAYDSDGQELWAVDADASGDLIKSGTRLYAGGKDAVAVIQLPQGRDDKAKVVAVIEVQGRVQRLLAASGRLLAVTAEGDIHVFSGEAKAAQSPTYTGGGISSSWGRAAAKALLTAAGRTEGYALYFGSDAVLASSLVRESTLQVVMVSPDAKVVDEARRQFDAMHIYGSRISVHVGDPTTFKAPPYFAEIVLVGEKLAARAVETSGDVYQAAWRSVRPYGGSMLILGPRGAMVSQSRRVGALKGSDDWTHVYGNVANTVKSDDALVKLPLGVLWFGGTENDDLIDRHGRPAVEQVAGGRLVLPATDKLIARDVYTGRELWRFIYPGTTDPRRVDTERNPHIIPDIRGASHVLTETHCYLALDVLCYVLDAATGRVVRKIAMPPAPDGSKARWGYLGLYDGMLLGGWGFVRFSDITASSGKAPEGGKAPNWSNSVDKSASRGLVAFDTASGKVLWKVRAKRGFIHNGIAAGGGKVYCLDRYPKAVEDVLSRRGLDKPGDYRIATFSAKTGQQLWTAQEDIFGSWLTYSAEHDVVVQATDFNGPRWMLAGNTGMVGYKASGGAVLWKDLDIQYFGPVIVHGRTILTNTRFYRKSSGALDLLTGERVLTENRVTGKGEPWLISRSYGCNYMLASENLLTFRSASAGYYDLASRSGTGNLGGFRSGCTNNLVIADGVLSAPDYTRNCTCVYQNQASLAMVHVPDLPVEQWTAHYDALNYYDFTDYEPIHLADEVRRVGINFGAPGDRLAGGGTLWLDFPAVGGASYTLPIEIDAAAADQATGAKGPMGFAIPMEARRNPLKTSRRHEAFVSGALPFVTASCVREVRKVSVDLLPGLETKVYKVAGGANDAVEIDKTVTVDGAKLAVGEAAGKANLIGLRFPGVQLAAGHTLHRAVVQFGSASPGAASRKPGAVFTVRGEASASATPFEATDANLSSRPKTQATVKWNAKIWTSPNMPGEAQRTSDLSPVLREVVSAKGWKPGGAMAVFFEGTGTRRAWAWEGDRQMAASLIVTTRKPVPQAKTYTVRLYFAELDDTLTPGRRVFDVAIQGTTVLKALDVRKAAGGARRGIVREFKGISATDKIVVTLDSVDRGKPGPILSGLEIIAE